MNPPDFFIAGGALQADAGCYVSRGADAELLEALRKDEFCYVLTTRQMGKSSLMVRTASQLREDGASVVIIDLTAIGQNLDVEQWYFSMLCHVGEKLDLEKEMEAYWDANMRRAPLHRFMGALREVYLAHNNKPLVIFVDEIDAVRSLRQFSADEFFAGIRECYNRRPEDSKLERLTFCLLGVATPSDLISDQRMTPFNIGHAIHLGDFTDADAEVLAGGLSPHHDIARTLLARVLWWTSGQPFLTQKLCAEVAKSPSHRPDDVDAACARIFLSAEARERDDNLHFVRDRLLRSDLERAALLDTYAKVCRGERMPDDHLNPVVTELRLSGIVRVVDGHLQPRNRIYSQVFNLKWVHDNLPDAEARRQRAAFYRGVRRVVGGALIVLAIMGVLVFMIHRSAEAEIVARKRAEEASQRAREAGRQAEEASEREKVAARQAKKAAEEMEAAAKQAKEAGEREKAAAQKAKEAAEEAKVAAVKMEDAAKRAMVSAEGERKAIAERLREAERTKAALDRLVDTQSKVEALLEALTPLVGDKSGKLILERAEDVVRGVKSETADDPRLVLGLAGLHRVCGRLYLRLGNEETALTQVQEAKRLVEAELQRSPTDAAVNKQLHDCLILIGDIMLGGPTPDTAKNKTDADYTNGITAYQGAMEIARSQSTARPEDAIWRGLYFADLNNLGDAARLFGRGKDKDAEARYYEALKAVTEWRKRTLNGTDFNSIEASIHDRLGTLFLDSDRNTEARTEFDLSLSLRRAIVSDEPTEDPERQSDLATSYNKLGNFSRHQGNLKEALDYYERSLAIRRKLCEQTRRRDWQRNLGFSLYNIGDVLWKLGENRRALDLGQERLKLAEALSREDQIDPFLKLDYANALYFYADLLLNISDKILQDWPRALELAQHAVEKTGRRDPRLLALLAQALRFAKRVPEAAAAIEEADKLMPPAEKRTEAEKQVTAEIAWEMRQLKPLLKKGK